MNLESLIKKGVRRVRKNKWADPKEFLQIDSARLQAYLVSPNIYALCQDEDLQVAASFQDTLRVSSQPIPLSNFPDYDDDWEEFKP